MTPVSSRGPMLTHHGDITTWYDDLKGTRGWALMMHNERDDTIRITSVVLFNCENIAGGCGMYDPKLILRPGEVKRIRNVVPLFPDRFFTFRWRYHFVPLHGYGNTLDEQIAKAVVDAVKFWNKALRDTTSWYWGLDFSGISNADVVSRMTSDILSSAASNPDTLNARLRREVSVRDVRILGDSARVTVTKSNAAMTGCSWTHAFRRYVYWFVLEDDSWRFTGSTGGEPDLAPAGARKDCVGRGPIP